MSIPHPPTGTPAPTATVHRDISSQAGLQALIDGEAQR